MIAREQSAREHLPRAVAMLGELGSLALRDPHTGDYFGMRYRPGRVLCASADGREMFILRPVVSRLMQPKAHLQTLHVASLYERFVHRAADEFYNCVVPSFRKPTFAGELVVIEYTVAKDIEDDDLEALVEEHDDDDDEHDVGLATWVHYFDEPGRAPAYPQLWQVGADQFYIPPGRWKVSDDGIMFAK